MRAKTGSSRMTLNKTRILTKRFGEYVRTSRISSGKSQEELGAYIGLSRVSVSARENGKEEWTLMQALDSLEFLEEDPMEVFSVIFA